MAAAKAKVTGEATSKTATMLPAAVVALGRPQNCLTPQGKIVIGSDSRYHVVRPKDSSIYFFYM
jgi:hypothetical protein